MTILQLSVVLLAALSLLNAVGVVALIRQVGVLHLRIQPVAGMPAGDGPEYGSQLSLPAALGEIAHRDATRYLVGFVSPGCGLCGGLTTAFGRIAKSTDSHTAVLLVLDATVEEADEYLRSKGAAFLPHIADRSSFTKNVPGAPWAVVTDRDGAVIVSGGVNTLDNVEEMLAQADYLIVNPPVSVIPPKDQSSLSLEASENVV